MVAPKLHGVPVSTNNPRVVACLHEKDVDFELVPVDLFARGNKEPSFLAKNYESITQSEDHQSCTSAASISGSEYEGSHWSIGWLEPHEPGF